MQQKVLVVFGYGPGISNAVAEKFGSEGFAVALVARRREKVEAGVAALRARGIRAEGFTADVANPQQVREAFEQVRDKLGAITAFEWTAYSGAAGDLLAADSDELRSVFDVAVVGLTTAVQAALPDLEKSENAAILVTNGGLGLFDVNVDRAGVEWKAMGLSLANSAKHKLVRLLAQQLAAKNIFVGEVVVMGTVKGTAFDGGQATIEPTRVAEEFWSLYTQRKEHSALVS